MSVVRAVHEPTRSESEGEHVCGPDVILTASVKGAREGARVKIMPVGCPQTAGRASRSGAGLTIGRRGDSEKPKHAPSRTRGLRTPPNTPYGLR